MENTDERLKVNILSILPSTSEETVNGVIQIVKKAGLETLSDLQFVEDDDLSLVLSPIQRRKLVKAWRDQSPLELEKSGDALATNPKIVEETLSRRSENSPHNKLNTDVYDPPKTSITASICQGEKRLKSLLRESYTESAAKTQQLPSSKAEEKIKESFMQNNWGQNQNIYNTGIGSCHYYLNAQNSFWTFKRFGNVSWDEKLALLFSSRGEDTELIIPSLPETDRLMEVHFARYKQRLLDKMLDYSRIVIDPYLEEASFSRIVSRTSYHRMNQWQQSNGSRLSDRGLATIENFKKGVHQLKSGYEKEGKIEIKKAADRGLPHAKYVYAIITFKEIVQHHRDSKFTRPPKKDIDEAFINILDIKREFFPLPSFVLGIMQLYNQISVSKKLAARVVTSPRENLEYVLRGVRYSEGNYNLIALNEYFVMEDKNGEYLKWIVQSSSFEFAKGMLPEDLPRAKSLLQELSSDGFADAKCLYALALLKNAFGDMQIFKKRNFDQAYTLLEEVINYGLKEAMFFFGIMPFRQEFQLFDKESQSRKGRFCFGYLGKYLEICSKDGEFKKDAAILIAAEYLKERDSFVTYDEEMAKVILRENDCHYELQELEEKLKERKEQANDVLPHVLDALEQVHNELEKNREPSAQQLSSEVKELLNALRGSGLIIQKSPLLLSTLQLICISSTMGPIFLLAPLQQLYNVLESQVVSQPYRFLQKEVLLSLRALYETCITLQMQRIRSVSHT